ncbi:hypothetical protein E4T66_13890 [Sinimarinibacterium sp. CAU 1509]|uniref:hypothetical protein n=1 Tax=Sinimarinibacterium sp. CAU 1509 TaxID=2562283 RepID=UPI0010ACAEF0|nr:hypothetical protein [Sinimarinibacterium sp. CAU 1509]TJY59469.1 hypothetical protein E4T66_13890 [Sinimarinibacterium sp. CAU 1509]
MDRATVFAKTERGREEMRTRSRGLPSQLRIVLIATDGVRRMDELGALYARVGDIGAACSTLMEHGLIEPVGNSAAVAPAAVASVRPDHTQTLEFRAADFAPDLEAIPDIGGAALEQVTLFLEQTAREMMGRDAQRFIMRLSLCVSLRHVYSLLPELRALLTRRRDAATATLIEQRLLTMMSQTGSAVPLSAP